MSCIAPLCTFSRARNASSVRAMTSTMALPIARTSIEALCMGGGSAGGSRAFAPLHVGVKGGGRLGFCARGRFVEHRSHCGDLLVGERRKLAREPVQEQHGVRIAAGGI